MSMENYTCWLFLCPKDAENKSVIQQREIKQRLTYQLAPTYQENISVSYSPLLFSHKMNLVFPHGSFWPQLCLQPVSLQVQFLLLLWKQHFSGLGRPCCSLPPLLYLVTSLIICSTAGGSFSFPG